MNHYFALYAKKLQELGYDPIPINPGEKRITIPDWQTKDFTDIINNPGRKGYKGISHRTAKAPAIDVDIRDSGVTAQLVEWMHHKGFSAFRYGERPKFACIAQWCGEPQRKRISTEYDLGRIEILGVGQQIVLYNVHPNGYEYEWPNDNPLEQDVGDLPVLTEDLISELFVKFESLMDAAGHVRLVAEKNTNTTQSPPVEQLTPEQIGARLAPLDPNCSYDEWVKTGMAIFHHGGVIQDWVRWSEPADNYPGDDALLAKWKSFSTDGAKASLEEPFDDIADLLTEQLALIQQSSVQQASTTAFESAHTAYHAETRYDWLIKGIVERDTISMLYGTYGTFKSFVMVDMGMHIAAGRPYLGRNTEQGAVFFLIGEGKNGIKRRIKAWFKYMDIKPDKDFPFYYSTVPANLNDPTKMQQLLDIMDHIASVKPAMIVIDTLHKSMPGLNENSAEDMGIAINEVEKLKQRHGTACWIVHHSGKDSSRGARGSSSIPGAMDNSYELIRQSNDSYDVELRCEKIKDGRKPEDITLEALEVRLGEDEDGDPITSLVMTSEVFTPAQRYAKVLGLDGLAAVAYGLVFESPDQTMDYQQWREAVVEAVPEGHSNPRLAFKRVHDKLFGADILTGERRVTLSTKITLFPSTVTQESE